VKQGENTILLVPPNHVVTHNLTSTTEFDTSRKLVIVPSTGTPQQLIPITVNYTLYIYIHIIKFL
jgi:hypothetical protein